jgi:hypothetical protein
MSHSKQTCSHLRNWQNKAAHHYIYCSWCMAPARWSVCCALQKADGAPGDAQVIGTQACARLTLMLPAAGCVLLRAVGDVPLKWYKDEDHIGYDIEVSQGYVSQGICQPVDDDSQALTLISCY